MRGLGSKWETRIANSPKYQVWFHITIWDAKNSVGCSWEGSNPVRSRTEELLHPQSQGHKGQVKAFDVNGKLNSSGIFWLVRNKKEKKTSDNAGIWTQEGGIETTNFVTSDQLTPILSNVRGEGTVASGSMHHLEGRGATQLQAHNCQMQNFSLAYCRYQLGTVVIKIVRQLSLARFAEPCFEL